MRDDAAAHLRSLSALAVAQERVIDALADPDGAEAHVREWIAGGRRGALVLRGAVKLEEGEPGHAPTPRSPVWVKIEGASAFVADLDDDRWRSRKIAGVARREEDMRCCDAPSCALERRAFSTALTLSGDAAPREVIVREARALASNEDARAKAAEFGDLLAEIAGCDTEASAGREEADGEQHRTGADDESGREASPLLVGRDLARYVLRSEGAWVVLRDHASDGPRASARRNFALGALQFAAAVAAWIYAAAALRAGSNGAAIASAAIAALLSLSGYAFVGVARFSSRYSARSSPLLAIGDDKLIVAPWVSRVGAVALRPEGRLGAAIPLHEVRGAAVRPRGDAFAVELDTDHGPIDPVVVGDARVAEFWRRAIERAIDGARHPKEGASARQRARAKARASQRPAQGA